YPLSGTWSHGLRAERMRQMLESKERFTREDFIDMQHDTVSLRAQRCMPHLLKVLATSPQPHVAEAARLLETWDRRMEVDRVGATIFTEFFSQWAKVVVQQRFASEMAALLSDAAAGLAASLLAGDSAGWFAPGLREPTILATMETVLASLTER